MPRMPSFSTSDMDDVLSSSDVSGGAAWPAAEAAVAATTAAACGGGADAAALRRFPLPRIVSGMHDVQHNARRQALAEETRFSFFAR